MSSFEYTGTQGYYNRLGNIIALIRNPQGMQGIIEPSPASAWGVGNQTINTEDKFVDTLHSLFLTDELGTISSLVSQFENWRNSSSGWFSYLRTLATNITIGQVNRERSLHQLNLSNALSILNQLMIEDSQTLAPNVVSNDAAVASANNVGQMNFAFDYTSNLGFSSFFPVPEDLVVITTTAQAVGSGGNEVSSVRGRAATSRKYQWDYPTGSGVSRNLNNQNPALSQNTRNLLNNSSFELFTDPAFPNNWVATDPGLNFSQNVSQATSGAASLNYVADGTNPTLTQQFGIGSGTTQRLTTINKYGLSGWVRADTSAPLAGNLLISLTDGTTIIKDVAGNSNLLTVDLTALTPNVWTAFSVFFTTGRVIPATALIDIEFNSVTSAAILQLDGLALTQQTALYTGGPYMFSYPSAVEANNPQEGDNWRITINNDFAGQVLTWMGWLFNMEGLEFVLPTAGSPTIPDTVIP